MYAWPCNKVPPSRYCTLDGWFSIYVATLKFSVPWSALTQDGKPCSPTAFWNSSRTAVALLLPLQDRNITFFENPSTPLWIINFHLNLHRTIDVNLIIYNNSLILKKFEKKQLAKIWLVNIVIGDRKNMSSWSVSDIQTRAEGKRLYIRYRSDANVLSSLSNSHI